MSDPCAWPQVDEPALREGLPLKSERWQSYLTWAVDAFKLATTVARPSTQIVTHLCYSEFADILEVRANSELTPAAWSLLASFAACMLLVHCLQHCCYLPNIGGCIHTLNSCVSCGWTLPPSLSCSVFCAGNRRPGC